MKVTLTSGKKMTVLHGFFANVVSLLALAFVYLLLIIVFIAALSPILIPVLLVALLFKLLL